MEPSLLSEHVALRIGLAARALPGLNVKALLTLLTTYLDTPLTEASLMAISPKKWRSMVSKLDGEFTRFELDRAHAALAGLAVGEVNAPQAMELAPLDGPSITVAMTSNREQELDGHFGSCLRILVYQVTSDAHQLMDVREVNTQLKGEERAVYLVSLLRGCDLLFTVSIGGPAAAKVTRAGVHPVKVKTPCPCTEQLEALSVVIAGTPPRWLANKLSHSVSV